MTDQQHRATPEQWEDAGIGQPVTPPNTSAPTDSLVYRDPACIAQWPDCYEGGYDPHCCRFPKSCSCEVRTSIPVEPQPEPADSLVERVASICASSSDDEPESWRPEALAAIREVASWLRSELLSRAVPDRLEQEGLPAALRCIANTWAAEIKGQPRTEFIGGIFNCIETLNEIAFDIEQTTKPTSKGELE
jgi:hypothetical protein